MAPGGSPAGPGDTYWGWSLPITATSRARSHGITAGSSPAERPPSARPRSHGPTALRRAHTPPPRRGEGAPPGRDAHARLLLPRLEVRHGDRGARLEVRHALQARDVD